jgi:hypothetical protein
VKENPELPALKMCRHFKPRTSDWRTPFPNYRKQHGCGEEGKYDGSGTHQSYFDTGVTKAPP